MRSTVIALGLTIILGLFVGCADNRWIPLFDGKSLEGWRPSENTDSWQVEEGALVTRGDRSHLFYVGEVQNAQFKNFELKLEVKTTPGSNSGIFIHTEFQKEGWPSTGYECQVLNSNGDVKPGDYVERKMTGSIYGIRNIWKAPVNDNEWFDYHIIVQGRTIQTYINDELMAEYTEPEDQETENSGRALSSGTFALQCHDPKSVVYYRNIRVKPLPENLPTPGQALEDEAFNARIIKLSTNNFPLMDLHVHLKGNLTMDIALANARKYGFTYGIAYNCGLGMTFEDDQSLSQFLDSFKKPPQTYLAMQAEGREWLDLFKPETVERFDYVFTDAMTWTNNDGVRMQLWKPEQVVIGDPQDFMEQLVARIESILREPIDIYVNATYLPEKIDERYDALWTTERMDRVIAALLENEVALEINDRYKIPSPVFIQRAKDAGVKFTFGTNNGGVDDLGRLEYCIEMIDECGLTPEDMWRP